MLNDGIKGNLPPPPRMDAYPSEAAAFTSSTTSATTSSAPGNAPAPPVAEQLEALVHTLDTQTHSLQRTLSFRVAEQTGRMVISVHDAETDELIRQIPAEEALQRAELLAQQISGELIKTEV